MVLKVKKLNEGALTPTLANEGEDVGFDIYALEDTTLFIFSLSCNTAIGSRVTPVKTGISAQFDPPAGGMLRTRSSMALKGINVVGGVIDAGYRGEILVLLENTNEVPYTVKKGDKIAQLIKVEIPKDEVVVVEELSESKRGGLGFGSSGK